MCVVCELNLGVPMFLGGGQVTTFVEDVVKIFSTYSVDVLGVSETGTHKPNNGLLRRSIKRRLEEKGLGCIWGNLYHTSRTWA